MTFQKQLQTILAATKWTQTDLALKLGVSFVSLNSWINGRSKPRKSAVQKVELLFIEILGSESLDVSELLDLKLKLSKFRLSVNKLLAQKKLLNKLTLYLTYHTNTIEGSTMTVADTEAVLFGNKVLTNRSQVEQLEAKNHQAAFFWLLQKINSSRFKITQELVFELHLRLMNGILSNAGQYRNHNVRIQGTKVVVTNYPKIAGQMEKLVLGMNTVASDIIKQLAQTHAEFEQIHPFSDGNGRIGRLLMFALALKFELMPPIVLKERKFAYYRYLELAQTKDNFLPLEKFIAESVIELAKLLK